MSKRIGELLLEKGLISPHQLDKALKTQLILGGHLGTCLIELGYVNETDFGRTLAELHGLRYAPPHRLRQIAPQIIRIFSWKMAEKYQAIPIRLEENSLHLAVIDPKNLGRLSTLTGYKIVPWIAPEFRVYEAMEAYYDVQRRPRYIKLCNHLAHPDRPRPDVDGSREAVDDPGSADRPRGTSPTPPATTAEDLGEAYGYGRSWREVADELFDGEGDRPELGDPRGTAVPPADAEPGSDTDVFYRRMSRAESAHELAGIVLDHLSKRAERCILFTVKGETASVWDWHGFDLSPERLPSLRFPVTSGSIFTLMAGEGVYGGPVPDKRECRWFYSALHLEVPAHILLLPIYLDDRLVATGYADGGVSETVRGTTEQFIEMAQRIGLALKMLVLKTKIAAVR
jgi:hypothetical protein